MPKSKLVVIWGKESLLCSSIEVILAPQKDWEVVSISNQEDLDEMVLAEETTQSDIVIIQPEDPDDPNNLPLQLLQNHPVIKMITVSLENNVIDVYSKQQISVKDPSDLITAIENKP